jgi:hypothetical protein
MVPSRQVLPRRQKGSLGCHQQQKPGLGNAPGGFGLSYDELLGFIGQLSDQSMIGASFWAGPLSDLP